MTDRLTPTTWLARTLVALCALVALPVLLDALLSAPTGGPLRVDTRAETAAALGLTEPGWFAPGQRPDPSMPLGFTPGLDQLVPAQRP
jgi:hypothetical protein